MKSESSHFEKPLGAKSKSSSEASKTDWQRLEAIEDGDILITPEHPEADPAHIVKGVARHGLRPLPRQTSVALRIDSDVLDWFKAQGPGYQARINAALRAFRDASA